MMVSNKYDYRLNKQLIYCTFFRHIIEYSNRLLEYNLTRILGRLLYSMHTILRNCMITVLNL